MAKEKIRCIFCHKTIVKGIEYCNRCGKDIRSMWKAENESEETVGALPMYCPNPKCHSLYTEGDLFCLQCGNDYGVSRPIFEKDFYNTEFQAEAVFCPECGTQCNEGDLFCDCGCDFRIHPKVSKKPSVVKNDFRCSVCGVNVVSFPGDMCDSCKKAEKKRTLLCPECKINAVKKFGDICSECMRRKPLKGVGEGFHVVK